MTITNFKKTKQNFVWSCDVNGEEQFFSRKNGSQDELNFRWFIVQFNQFRSNPNLEVLNNNAEEANWKLSLELEQQYDLLLDQQEARRESARLLRLEINRDKINERIRFNYKVKKGMLTAALVALLFIIESICMVQYENSPDGNQDYFGITRSNIVTISAPKVGVEQTHSYKYKENYVNHD